MDTHKVQQMYQIIPAIHVTWSAFSKIANNKILHVI